MDTWTFDILRQTGWDLWVAVCVAAALVLASYALFTRPWRRPRGWVSLAMIAVGVIGTSLVVALPPLHTPRVGLVWTFVLLCLLSTTFYLNLTTLLGPGRTALLLTIRIAALALLVMMFFEPVLRFISKPRPQRPILFLIDTSGSMSFPDVPNGPTRLQSAWQTLRPQLPRIREHFVPRFFTFSTDLAELKNPEELNTLAADGPATDIAGAISKAMAAVTRDDAAIVLISDGIDNTSPNVAAAAAAWPRPVHTLRVGSEQTEPAMLANVAVENVEAPDDFIVDHESKLKATIRSSALANRVIEVKMARLDDAGRPTGQITTQKLVLQPVAEGQTVELAYKPTSVGVQRLAVWIDPIAGERSTVDNRQEFQGLALDPRIKVLYIEGRVRPEYRELNRALSRDANIEVASLLRIQQDRFAVSGTVDGERLQGMPASMEQWRKFDVVILGDLDASFLSAPQQSAIEQFVLGGGGLLMIGGQNSFGPGSYKDTPVEKALPVFVGDLSAAQEKTQFVPRLTAEGAMHPAMEGLAAWFGTEDTPPERELPPLRGNVVVPRARSGAQVLLVHKDRPGPDGKPQIVLAVQLYGKGRSAAFTADTTYLWYLPLRGMGQDSPYNRFWGQLVRWLAGEDVRSRQRGAGIEGLLNKSLYQLGESVRVRAMVRDQRGDATAFAQVSLVLNRTGSRDQQQIPLRRVETRNGLYEAILPSPDKGDYTVELVATKDGDTLGKAQLKFTVIPPAEEMLKIAANPKLLAQLSQATQGFHYDLAELPRLLEELIRTGTAIAARQEEVPLSNIIRAVPALLGAAPRWPVRYDLPMQGMLVVVLLATEWLLRRRWQLP